MFSPASFNKIRPNYLVNEGVWLNDEYHEEEGS